MSPRASGAASVTIAEAGRVLGVSPKRVRQIIDAGRLGTVEDPRGRRRVLVADLDAEVARREASGEGSPGSPSGGARPDSREASPLPPDMLPVPVEDWRRVMAQLANLHQAGQELAEARERAAKAETEAAFLRERLAELRARPAPGASGAPRRGLFRRRREVPGQEGSGPA